MANVEFGTGKTVIILTIVAACFAVLWPKIFHPMLMGGPNPKISSSVENAGCCDVIFETDVNAIKIMTELCEQILRKQDNPAYKQGKLTPQVISSCRTEVQTLCGIDIAQFLSEKVRLGASYRQILDEIRTFNITVCLRKHFGISPGALGASRRMRIWGYSGPRLKQERPIHLRPDMLHPALRERGRAIPPSHVVPKVTPEAEQPAPRPPPLPGMRPPMGAAGHVVPPPKTGGTMGIIMPLYTIGIVIFFMYTVMKVFVRKSVNDENYKDFESDPEFHRAVFTEEPTENAIPCNGDGLRYRKKEESPPIRKIQNDASTTRLGWKERDTRDIEIDHLRKRLEETERAMERIVAQMGNLSSLPTVLLTKNDRDIKLPLQRTKDENLVEAGTLEEKPQRTDKQVNYNENSFAKSKILEESVENESEQPIDGPKVKVMGLETRAQCQGGHTWHRPPTPTLGVAGPSRGATPVPPASPEPTSIYLTGTLPHQSQLLVEDAETRAETPTGIPDPPVILTGKMTLSLISLDDAAYPVYLDPQPVDESDNFADMDSTLLDIDSALIDDSNQSSTGKQPKLDEETFTNYTSAEEDAEAEDTAADISVLQDNDDLADEYAQIWSGIEAEVSAHEDIDLNEEDIADAPLCKNKG